MKDYQRPEAELIMFMSKENITDEGAVGGGGLTSSPWSLRPVDAHDAAHGE